MKSSLAPVLLRTTRPRTAVVTAFLVAASLLAGACGSNGDVSSTSASDEDLVGQWQLDHGTLDDDSFPLVADHRITMTLKTDGSFGGTAACNGYGGTYELDGSRLVFHGVSITQMGCQPDVMASEAAFVDVLGRQIEVARDGANLIMSGPGVTLTFVPVPAVPVASVVGTTWELDTIIAGDTASSVQGDAVLRLDPDGTFTGSTGCRDLSGRYRIEGDSLFFPEMSAAGECTDDLSRQDSSVIGVLENARIEVDGDRLTLLSSGGEGLSYRAR